MRGVGRGGEEGRLGARLELRPAAQRASWSPEGPLLWGCPRLWRGRDSPCLRVAQCKRHTQVCPAEASPAHRLASWVLRSQHPGPVSAGSGPGVRSGAAPLPGGCRPSKLRRPLSWAWDSERSLLASRPLAKALLLLLRKMQQESSASPKRQGAPRGGAQLPRPAQASAPAQRADARRAATPGVPGTSCRSQDSAPGGVPAADRGPNQTGHPPRLPLPPRLPNTGFSPQRMSPPGLKRA